MAEATLALTLLFTLAVGALIGAAIMRYWSPRLKVNKEMAERLQEAEQELNSYRDEVTQHFTETSRLVNNLTQSYRDVHEHLANSAMKLTNPSVSQQFTRQLVQREEDSVLEVHIERDDTRFETDDEEDITGYTRYSSRDSKSTETQNKNTDTI